MVIVAFRLSYFTILGGLFLLVAAVCTLAGWEADSPNPQPVTAAQGAAFLPATVAAPQGPPDPAQHPDLAAAMRQTGLSVLRSWFATSYLHAGAEQAKNIELAAKTLRGTVLPPNAQFSFNLSVGPYTIGRGFGLGDTIIAGRVRQTAGGGVCQVAGTLHTAVLLAGLTVLERHHHSVSIPYMPPGHDAAVSIDGGKDYRFRNTSGEPLLIWTVAANRVLTVALYGKSTGPRISLHHEVLTTRPPGEIHQVDPQLPPGEVRVPWPGIEGRTIRYWLERETATGVEVIPLGVDIYAPSPRLIAVGKGAAKGE